MWTSSAVFSYKHFRAETVFGSGNTQFKYGKILVMTETDTVMINRTNNNSVIYCLYNS